MSDALIGGVRWEVADDLGAAVSDPAPSGYRLYARIQGAGARWSCELEGYVVSAVWCEGVDLLGAMREAVGSRAWLWACGRPRGGGG